MGLMGGKGKKCHDGAEADDSLHAWRERRPWHVVDQELRAAGCRIEHRRNGQEPVWSHKEHGRQPQGKMLELLGLDGSRE